MNKTNASVLAGALLFALSGLAFAHDPALHDPAPQPNDPDVMETGDPMPNEPSTATATALPSSGPRIQPAFADLDTDADGYIALDDIPAEFELSLQFEVADTDQDELLSFEEFEAYQTMPEEAELGE